MVVFDENLVAVGVVPAHVALSRFDFGDFFIAVVAWFPLDLVNEVEAEHEQEDRTMDRKTQQKVLNIMIT